MTIPKIIHYCWVGGSPKPQSVLYCIESWKRNCPDYEIREWNETNYDFTKNKYMQQAYETQKWGFVPDYARLDIIYEYGGIYLDTDVEMVRNFDELLSRSSFFGFEDTGEGSFFVACGLGFGAQKHNPLIKELRDYYDQVSFLNTDGSLNLTPAPRHNAAVFEKYGVIMNNAFQNINGNAFYPAEYFCPKIFKTGKTKITKKTFSIHHFTASWMDELTRKEIAHTQAVCLKFGERAGRLILYAESVWIKYGLFGSIKKILIQMYEAAYAYWPIISGAAKRRIKKEHPIDRVVLFDTGLESQNMGDHIIMENCEKHLLDVMDTAKAVHVSTHVVPADTDLCRGTTRILCGTNILSCRMRQYGLWKLPRDLENYRNIILMGVGFDSYNTKPDLYTRLLLRLILSKKGIHSVRDSFSESVLKSIGITNVVNTGCPTMWNLTPEHCARIPAAKATRVISTVTDYHQDQANDKAMLDILLENYEKVYLWLQGQGDLAYIQALGYEDKLTLIESSLDAYDAVLAQEDLDYVGTRLHAGIRALSKGCRSLIVSIDNRAECIAADTGLPIIKREAVALELEKRLTENAATKIQLPWENISRWKSQFFQ